MSRPLSISKILAKCTHCGDCRIWKSYVNSQGYPIMRLRENYVPGKENNARSVRRVLWERVHGEPPQGVVVMTCENRLCIQPAHMAVVDRSKAQTRNQATLHSVARIVTRTVNLARAHTLSFAQAQEIRRRVAVIQGYRNPARPRLQREIAAEYGVSYSTIKSVCRGDTWKAPVAVPRSSVWAMAANFERQAA